MAAPLAAWPAADARRSAIARERRIISITGFACAAPPAVSERVRIDSAGGRWLRAAIMHDEQRSAALADDSYRRLFHAIDEGVVIVEVLFDGRCPVDLLVLDANERARLMMAPDVIGRRLGERMPEIAARWLTPFAAVARSGTPERFQQHVAPPGRWYEVYVCALAEKGRAAAIVRDVTARQQAEAALRESEARLRLSEEWQALLLSVSDRLRQLSDPIEIMAAASEALARRLDVSSVGYLELQADNDTGVVLGGYDDGRMPPIVGRTFRHSDYGTFLNPLQRGEDLFVEDIRLDPRSVPGGPIVPDALQFVAGASIPLLRDGALVAYLFAIHPESHPWPDEERQLMREVAARTWASVERARAEAQLRQSLDLLEQKVAERTRALESEVNERRVAEERIRNLMRRVLTTQEEERQRIARDLHDHLGQHLTALHLQLDVLRRGGPQDEPWQQSFKAAQAYLHQFERELDEFTSTLRPGALYTLGLVAALADLTSQWAATYNIPAQFDAIGIGDERLAPEVETNLYRITQEALTNVAKHARATTVAVVLQRRGHALVLSIEDDGVGFDVDDVRIRPSDYGMGLTGVLERAALLDGDAQIESVPGHGTTVIVTVPEV